MHHMPWRHWTETTKPPSHHFPPPPPPPPHCISRRAACLERAREVDKSAEDDRRISKPFCACLFAVPASLTTIASLARTRLRHLMTSQQLAVRRTCKRTPTNKQQTEQPFCAGGFLGSAFGRASDGRRGPPPVLDTLQI